MVIEEFGVINFRNYRELFVNFSERINLFIGGNGQGKSNLAEAIYFLNHLESFRTQRLDELLTFGENVAQVQGRVRRGDAVHKARTEVTRRGRRAWLDDEPVRRLSTYAAAFYAVVFNPDSLYQYRNVPRERRAFYDRFAAFLERAYLDASRAFRTILSQKNSLLKSQDFSGLEAWNELFIQRACVIIDRRIELVGRINEVLPDLFVRLTGRGDVLRLEYRPTLAGDPTADRATLVRVREQEARAGHALYGPHRDDYAMVLEEDGRRRGEPFFSQGEYRVGLLALKLALNEVLEQRMGHRPVIILDDLYSELDAGVRTQLTAYLGGIANQVFVTSTEPPEALGLPDARVMEIRAGRIMA